MNVIGHQHPVTIIFPVRRTVVKQYSFNFCPVTGMKSKNGIQQLPIGAAHGDIIADSDSCMVNIIFALNYGHDLFNPCFQRSGQQHEFQQLISITQVMHRRNHIDG